MMTNEEILAILRQYPDLLYHFSSMTTYKYGIGGGKSAEFRFQKITHDGCNAGRAEFTTVAFH